jgi:curved DNA-binding protein
VQVDLQTAFDGGRTRLALHDGDGHERVLEVKIPAGIQSGQVIRLGGQGQPGMAGGPAGDLLLEVIIRDDARFRLDGRNVLHVLALAPWEAALGATVAVPTLAGPVDLRIPAGSQSGRKLRLKGRGLPGQPPGDQLVELAIRAPVPAGDAQREAYEGLRRQFPDYDPRA